VKLIIAGSRTLNVNPSLIVGALEVHGIQGVSEVIEGGCPTGADAAAVQYVMLHNELMQGTGTYNGNSSTIKHTQVKADWGTHGKAAGPIRNHKMAEMGDALLLVWDGVSKGSLNMKTCMEKLNKPIFEVIVK
jgi:hypothetical protein